MDKSLYSQFRWKMIKSETWAIMIVLFGGFMIATIAYAITSDKAATIMDIIAAIIIIAILTTFLFYITMDICKRFAIFNQFIAVRQMLTEAFDEDRCKIISAYDSLGSPACANYSCFYFTISTEIMHVVFLLDNVHLIPWNDPFNSFLIFDTIDERAKYELERI